MIFIYAYNMGLVSLLISGCFVNLSDKAYIERIVINISFLILIIYNHDHPILINYLSKSYKNGMDIQNPDKIKTIPLDKVK